MKFLSARTTRLPLILLSFLAVACSGGAGPTPPDFPDPDPDPDPDPNPPRVLAMYTNAQADAGAQVYLNICAVCHSTEVFTGTQFQKSWKKSPVGVFYSQISRLMPNNAPGSLRPEQYLNVTTYFLRLNGLPAGSVELPSDTAQLYQLWWEK